jgi:putative membrane protein
MMLLSSNEASRVEAAVRAAQARSSGQIVCVLAHASSHYEFMPFVWSALIALLTPWPLLTFTEIPDERIYLIQLTVFFAAMLGLTLPRLRLALTPANVRRANAHRAALEQFMLRGLSHGAERNGVLLYVSLAERFARVIADEGAAKVIRQQEWQTIIDQLRGDMARGAAADALISASTRCGDLLAQHFPPRDGVAHPLIHRFHMI